MTFYVDIMLLQSSLLQSAQIFVLFVNHSTLIKTSYCVSRKEEKNDCLFLELLSSVPGFIFLEPEYNSLPKPSSDTNLQIPISARSQLSYELLSLSLSLPSLSDFSLLAGFFAQCLSPTNPSPFYLYIKLIICPSRSLSFIMTYLTLLIL